jgi:hypothetical protein
MQIGQKPTVDLFLGLTRGILPKAIYEGGYVLPAPGRAVGILPFTAKSIDGLVISSTEIEVITVPDLTVNTLFWLVLYAKQWEPGDPNPQHTVEFRLFTDSDWQIYADKAHCIVFATIIGTYNTAIRSANIDCSKAQRVDIAQNSNQLIRSGSSTFNGSNGQTITHNLATLDYRVAVTPSGAPQVGLGDIWVQKTANSFTVFCDSVTEVNAFDWILTTARATQVTKAANKVFANNSNTPIGPGFLNSASSILIAYPMALAPAPLTWVEPSTLYLPNDSWAVKCLNQQICNWNLLDSSTDAKLVQQDIVVSGGSSTITFSAPQEVENYRALVIPLQSVSKMPIITRSADSIQVNGIDGTYRLVTIKNAAQKLRGVGSGSGSIRIQHGLGSLDYFPLIAFTSSVDAIDNFAVNIEADYFEVLTDNVVGFEWIIL